MILYQCPHCGDRLTVDDDKAGRAYVCQLCGKTSLVPGTQVVPAQRTSPAPMPAQAALEAPPQVVYVQAQPGAQPPQVIYQQAPMVYAQPPAPAPQQQAKNHALARVAECVWLGWLGLSALGALFLVAAIVALAASGGGGGLLAAALAAPIWGVFCFGVWIIFTIPVFMFYRMTRD